MKEWIFIPNMSECNKNCEFLKLDVTGTVILQLLSKEMNTWCFFAVLLMESVTETVVLMESES